MPKRYSLPRRRKERKTILQKQTCVNLVFNFFEEIILENKLNVDFHLHENPIKHNVLKGMTKNHAIKIWWGYRHQEKRYCYSIHALNNLLIVANYYGFLLLEDMLKELENKINELI